MKLISERVKRLSYIDCLSNELIELRVVKQRLV